MSEGLRPYDFVQQVYYAQEKVILDFWPSDDKYKEVLLEANLILQELQNSEDWTWLREQLILGPCYSVPGEITEFKLPDWVYKISTLNHDALRLHFLKPFVRPWHHHHHHYPFLGGGKHETASPQSLSQPSCQRLGGFGVGRSLRVVPYSWWFWQEYRVARHHQVLSSQELRFGYQQRLQYCSHLQWWHFE